MKQTELAELAQLSQGYLSDLESGRRKGARESLKAIAKSDRHPRELADLSAAPGTAGVPPAFCRLPHS
jgi:transcriptional regulator with XRE-family HTH domain